MDRKLAWSAFTLVVLASPLNAEDWPCWRGPRLDGTSIESGVPLHWSATSNVLWKTQLPGEGHASPIVFGTNLFTVTAVEESQERRLICIETERGNPRWEALVLKAPMEKKHSLNSHASSTPATDGHAVYVAFLDNDEMFAAAYSFEGKRVWESRPGKFSSVHGFCSSPILYRDKVLLNGDHDGDSYLVALSKEDGRVLWKTPRENKTRSYCAPLVRTIAGREQMVLSGDQCVASYHPGTGERHWIIDGPTEQFVASPVYSGKTGLVYITGGFPQHHILAIRPDGSGNITDTHIAWRTTEGAAYVPSPIIEGDYFLVIADSGIAHCFEAASGKLAWKKRLGEQHASLVSAEGRVYFLNDKGTTTVIKPGPELNILAQNELGEKCFASPAISNGRIYIRAARHVYCIAEPTALARESR